jgi:hypothetical protein
MRAAERDLRRQIVLALKAKGLTRPTPPPSKPVRFPLAKATGTTTIRLLDVVAPADRFSLTKRPPDDRPPLTGA